MTTLTEKKKQCKLQKQIEAAKASAPKESVLKKYEPPPCTGRVTVELASAGLLVTVREGQSLILPETEGGFRQLLRILRAQRAAIGLAPKLGSESYPTQHQIDQFLRLREEKEEQISEERQEQFAEMSKKSIEEMGI